MDTTTLNTEFLKAINACPAAIEFVIRNKLESLPLSRLNEIEGNYNYYVSWMKNKTWEFDQNNNKILEVDSDGDETRWEYDQNNNKIRVVLADGRENRWEYDQNNNKILEVDSGGYEIRWEYDRNNNKIRVVYPDGYEKCWETEYYDNGQLKRIGDMAIPLI